MGLSKLRLGLLVLAGCAASLSLHAAPLIQQIDYDWGGSKFGASVSDLKCPGNPALPPDSKGCSLNQTLVFENLQIGEHFRGQTLSRLGSSDVLGGHDGLGGALNLQAGETGKNLAIVNSGTGVLLGGVGPDGSSGSGVPSFSALGTGAISLLFNNDQSRFGFRLHNWDGVDQDEEPSTLFLAFFDFKGNLIGDVLEWSLPNDTQQALSGNTLSLAFGRVGGVKDIAGVSIWNNDDLGMQISGMQHDQDGLRDPGNNVPEPGALMLGGLALLAAGAAGRRKKR